MRFPIGAAVATLVLAASICLPAVEPPPIRLDAVITDRKDRPIRDLKASDFEISDAGSPRPVDAVSLQSSPDGRLVAIFMDEYHVQAGGNTERARAALQQFVAVELRAQDTVAIMKPLDPLNAIQLFSVAKDRAALQAQIESFSGRKGDYTPTTDFERNFMSRASGPADVSRAQIVSSALQTLALRIGGVRQGRKSVVLVSEGFSPSLPRGSDRMMGSLRAIVYTANRYEVAIYPVDPGEAAASGEDSERDASTLRTLADQTGGEAAFKNADLMPALRQAAADLDDYYVVTYTAATGGDGQFHPVQLRVKRADAQVRIRSGYWSADEELLKAAAATAVRASAVPMRPAHSSPLIRPWIGTARGPDGLTNVTVVWEPGLAPPRNQRVGSVELKATGEDGQVLFDAPLIARGVFSATPGFVHLEMTIRGLDGKTLDSDYRSIAVPNLTGTRLTFGTVQVVRTRNAREFGDASADAAARPAASREFSRAERLLLRVPVYAASGATPVVKATLLNPLGAPMRVLSQVSSNLPPEIVQFDLLLSSLAPDDYRVELTAAAGAEEAKTLLLFRVTN